MGLDLSLASPGFAAVSVRNRKPRLIAATHVRTGTDENYAQRYEAIEAFTTLFIREQLRAAGRICAVIRESFPPSRNPRLPQTIYGAWAAVDRGLHKYGVEVADVISPTDVKKRIAGSGKAEKADVAEGVRKLLGLPEDYRFATDDESDACAVALAWLIGQNIIDGKVAE
ncbi:crossover junction endodeoxyribonuclease RuvC [Brevibacillus borstelensis]|uniref:crossover junction endodeoxyribonuclease RuvC n=1 Tax=Brevibacillus borstelensis TaxID=45462 RepID=UPI00287FD5AB|nr:crossover junction endodeoxyribonuclease RuvC [Brevibacillus borstelensis]WNF08388.1 crossover junction endodeoxyribonuclease RuvC [Brevibacillus borstelensis]